MMIVCNTVIEVKDADDSYGLFDNLDSAIEFAAEMLDTDINNIELILHAHSDCMRVTINGAPQSLWLEYRDVMC